LAAAALGLRRLRIDAVHSALQSAQAAAERAGVPALRAEVAEAAAVLDRPAARRVVAGAPQPLRLHEVAALMHSGALVVDACRHSLCMGDQQHSLARRPILFVLLRALAEAWPEAADRDVLITRAFRMREADDTHRARLRVEIGRLRRLIADLGTIEATARGFALRAREGRARSRGPCARQRPGPRKALAGAAADRIHDDLVTPCRAAAWLDCLHAPNAARLQQQEDP
jgi:hypothetical protein